MIKGFFIGIGLVIGMIFAFFAITSVAMVAIAYNADSGLARMEKTIERMTDDLTSSMIDDPIAVSSITVEPITHKPTQAPQKPLVERWHDCVISHYKGVTMPALDACQPIYMEWVKQPNQMKEYYALMALDPRMWKIVSSPEIDECENC